MLFRSKDLEAIFSGSVTTAFRRWKKPTVKAGGTIRTQRGLVAIDAVEEIDPSVLTEADATAANYPSLDQLQAMFAAQEGVCYRIKLHPSTAADPREELRAKADLSAEDIEKLVKKLDRLDVNGGAPWTRAALKLIADQPGVVSTKLAPQVGLERFDFKDKVTKLKALGLTISLATGYRLSPRGEALLKVLG